MIGGVEKNEVKRRWSSRQPGGVGLQQTDFPFFRRKEGGVAGGVGQVEVDQRCVAHAAGYGFKGKGAAAGKNICH